MRPFVSGLVLAAGGSTRLAQPKQLLPFRGATLLGWVMAQVSAATSLDEVIVVLGGVSAEIRTRVNLTAATVVENPDFAQGCSSSYRVGVGAVDRRAAAVAVLLGDQPGVDGAVIDRVVEAWRRNQGQIVVASYRDRPGHPIIFPRSLFDQLAALKGDKAAWKILDAHPEWVHHADVDRLHPPDVNTWRDYEAALSFPPSS